MFGLLKSAVRYDWVMKNSKIKNKRWGFLWREALIEMAVILAFILLCLLIGGIDSISPFQIVLLALLVLVSGIVGPLIMYQIVRRDAER